MLFKWLTPSHLIGRVGATPSALRTAILTARTPLLDKMASLKSSAVRMSCPSLMKCRTQTLIAAALQSQGPFPPCGLLKSTLPVGIPVVCWLPRGFHYGSSPRCLDVITLLLYPSAQLSVSVECAQ